jgi:DNA mismatch repair protein MutS2
MIKKDLLELFEFDKLLRKISPGARSDVSRRVVLNIRPLGERKDIEKRRGLINEIRRIIQEGSPFKFAHFADISQSLKKVRPEGAVLEASELYAYIPVLKMSSEISTQVSERSDLDFLAELAGELKGYPDLLRALERSVDSEGNVLDSASFVLADLRREIRKSELNINKRLEEMMRDSKVSIFLQDTFITKRAGRWVIPVRMDSKGQVPGVVHDISKSGETAFIEPLGLINLSNELENLVAEAKAEEIRILRQLSSDIRFNGYEIAKEFEIIVYLDALDAIARFAEQLNMQTPQINSGGMINLVDARHPLLHLVFSRSGFSQQVVPLNVRLGDAGNVMVITGSNAGGKTIALKTIGLVVIMTLSGMPVPADSSSSLPLVENLLADIGDEQSVESSLSTFAAHVSNIAEILDKGSTKTLILIDELGTGTDPDEGTALSCAVLKKLLQSGALVFASTHLTGIKGFVHMTEGMINASMEFDQKTLTPLYRLRIGEPGQSHALEVAKKYGLPDEIVSVAKEMLGNIKVEFDTLIADLNNKRAQCERELEELNLRQADIDRKQKLVDKLFVESERRKKEILSEAHKEALNVVVDIKRQLYKELDEIRKQDKKKARESLKKVEKTEKLIKEKIKQHKTRPEKRPKIEELDRGDIVYVESLGYDALIVDVVRRQERLRVRAGNVEFEVPLSDVELQRGMPLPVKAERKEGGIETGEFVASSINIVGLRVDESVSRLERFLNDASLAGFNEVTIIHGIGKGLLLKAVHGHLKDHPLVRKFRKGEQSEGGSGVTMVTLV